ncbi:MAG: T9SS type A sorting domain-containing protein [candidate division WOR-3 bacterium]
MFVFWLGLFSSVNAQSAISPASPFFNKVIKEEINLNKPDSQKYIISAHLTFNRVFICKPRSNYTWVITDRYGVVSDIDGNGLNDIPFTSADMTGDQWNPSFPGNAYVAFQTSPGNFQCVAVGNQKDTPYGISVGDFDGDGDKDLVYTAARSNGAYTLRNNGGWSFTEQQIGQGGGFPNHIAVRNVDAGPGAEILYTDEVSSKLFKYNFLTNSLYTLDSVCREGLSIADLNGDGTQDVVCGASNVNAANWLYYKLNLGYWTSPIEISNTIARWHGIATADLNKDAKIDIVTCRAANDTGYYSAIYVFYNNGGNIPTFSPQVLPMGNNYEFRECEVTIADLDCDGDYDIVWASGYGNGGVGWLENNFPNNSWTYHTIELGSYKVYGVAVSYINNDKKPDIIAGLNGVTDTTTFTYGLYVYYNTSNIDTTLCLPITPVDIPEKLEINAKIEVKGKEVKFILNRNINDKLDIFDVSGKKLWTYYINGQQLVFRIPNSGVYVMRLRDKSYKIVVK